MSSKIFRISGLPLQTDIDTLRNALHLQQEGINLKATVSPCCSDPTTKVAIVEFYPHPPSYLNDVITGVKTDHQIQMNEEYDLNIDMDFYGLTQLYATPHKAYITADIVAVTGIAGHAFGSWRGKGDLRRMWLQDFLKKDLPNCRTMIFGYDSKLDSPGTHEIEDYRDNLLTELKKARMSDEERNRPMIFIGHSFGGIIITQALVKSQDSGVDPASDLDTHAIYKSTYATIFFGTPHRGFNVKSLTKLVDKRKSGERLALLNSIQTGSKILKECLERFLTFADQLKVVSFYETIKSQTPEKVDTRFERIGPYELSVPKESALLNLCGVEVAVGVNKDHTQLVKFDNKQCSAYSDTIVHLKRFERDISPQKTAPLTQAWADINRHYSQDTSGGFVAAYYAIESQDVDQLANLCNSDELNSRNINLRHDNGSTLLHMAMLMGGKSRVKMVEWLLRAGADWMARNKRRVTPFVQVAMTEPRDAVRELLPLWIDIKTLGKDQRGWSQLHVAAAYGNSHAVGVLINLGADIEARNDDMSTPLHEAIRSGNIYTMQVLLTFGAHINARNMNGMTALDLAANHGRDDLARILLDNKADVTVTDNEKWTPLHTASSKGHDSLVTVLLQHKASVDARDLQGQTPIYLTVKNGHQELSRKLLHEGANLSVSDSQGRTVLHYAAITGDDYVTQVLLENGADAMAADGSGKTPLHCAVKSGHSDVGRVLLNLGRADVTSVDHKKRTPLHHAARNGHSGSVKLLLLYNAPIESKDIQGSTPLLHAANSGHGATVKILLDENADINAKDEQGCSALHLSTKQGHLEVLIQLVGEGIKVDETDANGQTALQIAYGEGNDKIIKELKKGEVSRSENQVIGRGAGAIGKEGTSRSLGIDIGKAFVDEFEADEDDISTKVFYFLVPVLVVVTLFAGY